MTHKVKLKNSKDVVLFDEKGYKYLTTDPYLVKVDFINNLRRHSSGCAVFQKSVTKSKGKNKITTIYLHRLIAEKFKSKQKSKRNNVVGAVNGNKLDCQLDNIIWRSRSVSSRMRKSSSKLGHTGVYVENNRYRAVIAIDGKSNHIGMYPTIEEAAMAYNKMSRILYGDNGKINIIKKEK